MENLGANWESYPSQMRNRLLALLIKRVALGHELADEGNLLRMLWSTAIWETLLASLPGRIKREWQRLLPAGTKKLDPPLCRYYPIYRYLGLFRQECLGLLVELCSYL